MKKRVKPNCWQAIWRATAKIPVIAALLIAPLAARAAMVTDFCGFSAGCGPDIALSTQSAAFDSTTGTLSLSGLAANASFLDGQVNGVSGALSSVTIVGIADGGTTDPSTGKPYSFSLQVDSNGALTSGDLNIRGEIIDPNASLMLPPPPGDNPWQSLRLEDGSAQGVEARGLLVGGLVDSDYAYTLDPDGTLVLFFRFVDASANTSVFEQAGYRSGTGLITLRNTGLAGAANFWSNDWSSNNVTFDVVLPLPAGAWLFLSGIALLAGRARVSAKFGNRAA